MITEQNDEYNTPWETRPLEARVPMSQTEFRQAISELFHGQSGITEQLMDFATSIRLVIPEDWAPIAGYEDLYEVSNLGNVRSLTRVDSLGRKRRGRLLCPWLQQGYRHVSLSKDGVITRVKVACLVAEALIGRRETGEDVCHNDGNPLNDAEENLRYDTRRANMNDRWGHGTMPYGEGVSGSKLTECDVLDILTLLKRGSKSSALARKYGVSPCLIKDIKRGKNWAYLTDPSHPAYRAPPTREALESALRGGQ